MRRASLSGIVEEPEHLWVQPGVMSDRIHQDVAVRSVKPFQSLYLIRAHRLRFRIWQTEEPFLVKGRKHRRAVFTYRDREYNLPTTDPTLDARHFSDFPGVNQPAMDIEPRNPDNCLLVVSLATPFTNGYHYKVVATVLETEE